MSLSSLPLSYCTNVHIGRSLEEVRQGLRQYTAPLRENYARPLAAGLWLARPVVEELLQAPTGVEDLAGLLDELGLSCHTLNAFPYGDFHSDRVKENVYLPDWSQPERLEYTLRCAQVLASLLPDGAEGSVSTLPLGFKEFEHPADFQDVCLAQLIELARGLDQIRQQTGRIIRLAVEPEPFCLIETTSEAIRFFEQLCQAAAGRGFAEEVRQHIGMCYDVCHQAVEFEDIPASIRSIDDAGIRINKIHITCAIQVEHPAENEAARRALAQYVEPRYLHQTMAKTSGGEILRAVDLTEELALNPDPEFQNADLWRTHFHVPVNAETLGPLQTTRTELRQALESVALLDYAPHLEVETYTWEVLPGRQKIDLVDGLTNELTATRALIGEIRNSGS